MNKGFLRVSTLSQQLARMRKMQYAYHKKFFHGLYLFLVLVLACLLWDSPLSLALVPFLVITAGTQSCFYLHFVDFARLHARHLETRLNKALGKGTLVGSEIEDVYFYPIDAPKIGVFVGVLVGVLVGVFVGVLVGVSVGVSVGVLVGVFVGVLAVVS